jgi:hypothetical protein
MITNFVSIIVTVKPCSIGTVDTSRALVLLTTAGYASPVRQQGKHLWLAYISIGKICPKLNCESTSVPGEFISLEKQDGSHTLLFWC